MEGGRIVIKCQVAIDTSPGYFPGEGEMRSMCSEVGESMAEWGCTSPFIDGTSLSSRTVASTNMNAVSSRSHAVFTIILTQKRLNNNYTPSCSNCCKQEMDLMFGLGYLL